MSQPHGRIISVLIALLLLGSVATSIFFLERSQTLRQELLQLQAQQVQLIAAEKEAASILQEELKRHDGLAAEMRELLMQINELESQIATARDKLDPEKLRLEAIAELEAERNKTLTEGERNFPLSFTNLANRLLTQDIDQKIEVIETAARFGAYLDRLGITGARRDSIVEAIAQANVESTIASARFFRGDISRAEHRALTRPRSSLNVLEALLTEDEKAVMPQIRADYAKKQFSNNASIQIGLINLTGPRISVPSAYKFGEIYAEERSRLRQQHEGAVPMEQQLLSLTLLREKLRTVIPESEMGFVDTFLANEVTELQMSQRQEALDGN